MRVKLETTSNCDRINFVAFLQFGVDGVVRPIIL